MLLSDGAAVIRSLLNEAQQDFAAKKDALQEVQQKNKATEGRCGAQCQEAHAPATICMLQPPLPCTYAQLTLP